jgi:hypothetical protein
MMGSSRVALRLESLNDRTVPSVTVVQDGTTLTVKGDAHANDIEIHDNGTPAGLTVTVDGVDQGLSGLEVTKVVVKAGGGADTVSYALEGDYAATARTVEVWLGNGNDTFTADLGHAIGADSSLTLQVHGGNGKDDLSVAGAGGSVAGTLDVQLDGQNGMDVVSFDYTGDVTGTARWTAEGGNGKDDISLHYAGVLDGTLELNVKGGNGMDHVAADVAATGGAGTVTGEVLGGNGKDDLSLSVASGLTLDVTIDGGHGKDTITAPDGVTVVDAAKN